jgi:3-oxoacyl-[acyl-carrier protein] reductase
MEDRKVAVVAGASRGIGLDTAKWLISRGWEVAICASNAAGLRAAASDIETFGGSSVYSEVLDISEYPATQRFSENVRRQCGRVSLLICSAAVLGPVGSITDIDPLQMEHAVRINTLGPMNVIRSFATQLFERSGSRVVLFSGGGLGGNAVLGGAPCYVPSKAFCVLLVELLAREFAGVKGSIMAISPGLMPTNFMRSALEYANTVIPSDLARAAGEQERLRVSRTGMDLDLFFRLLERFMSPQGERMNGRLLSAKWDADLNFEDNLTGDSEALLQLRRIDGTLFSALER